MDAKLKSLKVADLRELLTTAGEPAPSKANKQDLISRVAASSAALAAYRAKYEAPAKGEAPEGQEEDELVDYTDEIVPTATQTLPTLAAAAADVTPSSAPAEQTLASVPSGASDSTPAAPSTSAPVDPSVPYDWRNDPAVQENEDDPPELKARKARCRRFNMPLVDPSTVAQSQRKGRRGQGAKVETTKPQGGASAVTASANPKPVANGKPAAVLPDDAKKLEERRKRFERLLPGQKASAPAENGAPKLNPTAPAFSPRGTKRASEEVVSEEELKRKRRQERFADKKTVETAQAV
ncbi:hypothetical protein BD626DRAFT_474870 [Schizophyllum amplum]|uniref:THO1-MOS11 C-terminal domain-containing protein n=1 Tax=Schizophyllum amplum TaxID=97359 RepID=A0A550CXX4_9AGAR|nr:hypothetical protein BD626DRAFT_474870 [Auriculariopsis ampla]